MHLKQHCKLLCADREIEDVAHVFLKKTQLMRTEWDIGKLGVHSQSTDVLVVNAQLDESRSDCLNWRSWGKIGLRQFALFHSGMNGRSPNA
jgi:hypothetical protein